MQSTIASTDAERVPFWSALINDRRIAPALGLGFTSGMPFLLTYSTQSAWLTDAGVPLATIGLLSELTLAYKFKFVWAPFLDQYDPPLIGRVLGRRRGWLLVAILAVMAMLAGIAFGDQPLDLVDGRILLRARDRGRNARSRARRLAHHECTPARETGGAVLMDRDRLARRQPRGRRRRALPRRSYRLEGRLSVHGGPD